VRRSLLSLFAPPLSLSLSTHSLTHLLVASLAAGQLSTIPLAFRAPALAHARASFLGLSDFLDAHALAGAQVCAALEMLRADGRGGWDEGDVRRARLYDEARGGAGAAS